MLYIYKKNLLAGVKEIKKLKLLLKTKLPIYNIPVGGKHDQESAGDCRDSPRPTYISSRLLHSQ